MIYKKFSRNYQSMYILIFGFISMKIFSSKFNDLDLYVCNYILLFKIRKILILILILPSEINKFALYMTTYVVSVLDKRSNLIFSNL
jgi:hypothetical protein